MDKNLYQLARTVSRADSLEALTRPFLKLLQQISGLDSIYLTRVDPIAEIQEIVFSLNTRQLNIPEGLKVPWQDTLCRRALEDQQIVTRDVPARWGDSRTARELGIQTYISVPITREDGSLYGTLCAASDRSVEVDEGIHEMLALFSDLIAWQLTREARFTAQRERADLAEARVEEMHLITSISTLCLNATELKPVLVASASRLQERSTWLRVVAFDIENGELQFHDQDHCADLIAVVHDLIELRNHSTTEFDDPLLLPERSSPALDAHRRALGLPESGSTALIGAISDQGMVAGMLLFANRQVPPEGNEARLLKSCSNLLSLLADRVEHLEQLDRANRRLAIDALHDVVTGLPNRRYLIEQMGQLLAREARGQKTVHIAFIDLDGFKLINDRFGHETGDEFLKAIASRLVGAARDSDLVARYGGDEFVVVATSGHPAMAEDECVCIAERLTRATSGHFELPGITLDYAGPSIGCISAEDEHADIDDLLARADAAMYEVKKLRKRHAPTAIES